MMLQRILRWTIGLPIAIIVVSFAIANRQWITVSFDPFSCDAPFAAMGKAEVIRLGRALGVPLQLTLSCMQPRHGLHCGRCSKCRQVEGLAPALQ